MVELGKERNCLFHQESRHSGHSSVRVNAKTPSVVHGPSTLHPKWESPMELIQMSPVNWCFSRGGRYLFLGNGHADQSFF